MLTVTDIRIDDRKFNYETGVREYDKKPRAHVFPEGETILENLMVGRRNRPVDLYRAEVAPAIKAAIAQHIAKAIWETRKQTTGVDPDSIRLNWSRTAGCSCGCSPGYIVTVPPLYGQCRFDVYVKVTGDQPDEAAVTPEAQPALDGARLQAAVARAKSETRTGRGPSGKLRNFRAMSAEKRGAVVAAIFAEGNDPEAMTAVWRWA